MITKSLELFKHYTQEWCNMYLADKSRLELIEFPSEITIIDDWATGQTLDFNFKTYNYRSDNFLLNAEYELIKDGKVITLLIINQ